jgi:pimeloyl-ACP methyl ester carboxylesterase
MKLAIKGNYKSFSRLEITRSKYKTNLVVLYLHGLYGDSLAVGSKSYKLQKNLHKKLKVNTVLFSTSRDWNLYQKDSREKIQEAFSLKTFQQEEEDIYDVIKLILDFKNELFNIKQKIRIVIIANSIAGTIVANFAYKFQEIRKIILCGSGMGGDSKTKPILSTKPRTSILIRNAKKFQGKVYLLQGTMDNVVPKESGEKLLSVFPAKNSKLIKIYGANHNFSSIFGKNKKKAVELYILNIEKILKK